MLKVVDVETVEEFLRNIPKYWFTDRVSLEMKRSFLDVLIERIILYHSDGREIVARIDWRYGTGSDIILFWRPVSHCFLGHITASGEWIEAENGGYCMPSKVAITFWLPEKFSA